MNNELKQGSFSKRPMAAFISAQKTAHTVNAGQKTEYGIKTTNASIYVTLLMLALLCNNATAKTCSDSVVEKLPSTTLNLHFSLSECFDKFSVYYLSIDGAAQNDITKALKGDEFDINSFKPQFFQNGDTTIVTLRMNDRPLKDKLRQITIINRAVTNLATIPFPDSLLNRTVKDFKQTEICDLLDYGEGGEKLPLYQRWKLNNGTFEFVENVQSCK